MESSCCRKASSASLFGENMREWRELLGGSVVGTAKTPPSASPPDTSRDLGRFRTPAGTRGEFTGQDRKQPKERSQGRTGSSPGGNFWRLVLLTYDSYESYDFTQYQKGSVLLC